MDFNQERELVLGCLRKDRDCQKVLFESFAGKMMTICIRYARHHAEAEDILQDGFVKVFQHLEQYKFEGSFEGWMRRIFVNTSLKSLKKLSFQNEIIGSENTKEEHEDPSILSQMSELEILEIIKELPDGYRTVFNLNIIEGFSHKEIGEMLNITESTSRSQLLKARRELQRKIMYLQKVKI
ncbi:MAG TPA: sigma-70 family RNA polymerase sigma factor [Saprospiraceae bacterium]|nr:sigma-70 family RNA polymerase sigma factor [Saprospiraceae bacterium]